VYQTIYFSSSLHSKIEKEKLHKKIKVNMIQKIKNFSRVTKMKDPMSIFKSS